MSLGLKLGIAAAALLGVYAYGRARAGQGGSIADAASAAVDAVSPLNPDNVFASSVNRTVSVITGRDTNLGGEIFDFFHRDPVNSWTPPSQRSVGNAAGFVGESYVDSGIAAWDAALGRARSWSADPLMNDGGMNFRYF